MWYSDSARQGESDGTQVDHIILSGSQVTRQGFQNTFSPKPIFCWSCNFANRCIFLCTTRITYRSPLHFLFLRSWFYHTACSGWSRDSESWCLSKSISSTGLCWWEWLFLAYYLFAMQGGQYLHWFPWWCCQDSVMSVHVPSGSSIKEMEFQSKLQHRCWYHILEAFARVSSGLHGLFKRYDVSKLVSGTITPRYEMELEHLKVGMVAVTAGIWFNDLDDGSMSFGHYKCQFHDVMDIQLSWTRVTNYTPTSGWPRIFSVLLCVVWAISDLVLPTYN